MTKCRDELELSPSVPHGWLLLFLLKLNC